MLPHDAPASSPLPHSNPCFFMALTRDREKVINTIMHALLARTAKYHNRAILWTTLPTHILHYSHEFANFVITVQLQRNTIFTDIGVAVYLQNTNIFTLQQSFIKPNCNCRFIILALFMTINRILFNSFNSKNSLSSLSGCVNFFYKKNVFNNILRI